MVRGLAVLAGASVTAGQEQDRAMDNPISTPQPAAGSPRRSAWAPALQRTQGAMGDRRVSEPAPEARLRRLRPSEQARAIAGAVVAHRGLSSRTAIAGAPIAPTAATRMRLGLLGGADRAPRRPSATTAQAIDWCKARRQLMDIRDYFKNAGKSDDAAQFKSAVARMDVHLRDRFRGLGSKKREELLPLKAGSAGDDPAAAAALADIDWGGIEELTGMMDLPSLSA